MIIESSPTNLDPRVGVDAHSERIDDLLFDSLVRRDDHFNLQPWLAERWEIPDPQTYIFHLRHGVRFHNGQPLTARDVKWTFDSLLSGKMRSAKAGSYAQVSSVEAPDDYTVIFHLKQPFAPHAVESLERHCRHCALRQRRTISIAIPLAPVRFALSARSRTRTLSSSAIPITGPRRRNCRESSSK